MNSTQPTRRGALAPGIAIRGHAGSGPDCQVLVVGAGPTGLVLGPELLARGIRTRIIDKGDGMALESRAIGIHARTLEVLDMMGLAERFTERGQVVRHLRFYSSGRCLVSLDFARNGSRFGFLLDLPQDETERLLRARIIELGGVIEPGAELTGLVAGNDAVDSPAAQVATERHSRNLPPAVGPAATPLPRYAFSILQVGVVPVTSGLGDQGAADAAARGYLRASHADREHVIHMLKAAFVQGMLTKAELDARLGQTFAARTHGELAVLTADLPAGLADAVPQRRAARAQTRPPMSNAAKVAISVVIAVAVAVIVSIPTDGAALFVFAPFYFMALLVAGAQILASRHEKRSRRGQLPPRPAQFGQTLEGERDGGPGNDLILCQAHRDTRARRLLGHSVTQRTWRSVPTRQASADLCT